MDRTEQVARNLAASLLAGAWTPDALLERTEMFLGQRTRRSQRALIDALIDGAPIDYPPSPAWLVSFFLRSPHFRRASRLKVEDAKAIIPVLEPARFAPTERFAHLAVPQLATPGDLAAWLQIPIEQLDWLADEKRRHGTTAIPILQHYWYRFVPKASGPPRLIEIPKPRLKTIQRRILRDILDLVPTHDCAYGFVAKRSCLSAAQVHAGEHIVATVDLESFFLNTRLSRVHGLFRSLGYPWAVARLLTSLCSTSTPRSVFTQAPAARRHDWMTQKIHQSPHLPQGAPTSPALANLAAWHLDVRLHGLARSFSVNYTRYADDLAFSGDRDLGARINRFLAGVQDIARDQGFKLNSRKTRIMRRAARQRVTGIIVNDHVNVPRDAYDTLKATLHNCIKNGPDAENRAGVRDFRAHLNGRIAWIESVNPARAQRLRRMLDDISWQGA